MKSQSQNQDKKEKAMIEAVLFASSRSVTPEQISQKIGVSKTKTLSLLKSMQKERQGQGVELECISNSWRFTVRRDLNPHVSEMTKIDLNRSILTTLSIIAYNEPAVQSTIVKIRGNKAYEHIAYLKERGFIKTRPYGRTNLIRLDKGFYDYFDTNKKHVKKAFDNKFEIKKKTLKDKVRKLEKKKEKLRQKQKRAEEKAKKQEKNFKQ